MKPKRTKSLSSEAAKARAARQATRHAVFGSKAQRFAREVLGDCERLTCRGCCRSFKPHQVTQYNDGAVFCGPCIAAGKSQL